MKFKGRRLSVQEKVESKRSGVPRLRVLFALFAALLVIGALLLSAAPLDFAPT